MQNPTDPTVSEVTSGSPSRWSTAPDSSSTPRATGSARIIRRASSLSWATLPPYRSGARATNPSAASRRVTSAMWSVSPHHSWMTTTPGPRPDGGSARYPWAVVPALGKVTFWWAGAPVDFGSSDNVLNSCGGGGEERLRCGRRDRTPGVIFNHATHPPRVTYNLRP